LKQYVYRRAMARRNRLHANPFYVPQAGQAWVTLATIHRANTTHPDEHDRVSSLKPSLGPAATEFYARDVLPRFK
jgi:hypothetical protein